MEVVAYGSAHRSLLDDGVPDVERLIDLHVRETGSQRGRRRSDIQVINRSAVVLVCAYWEAFCEDLAAEALHHMAEHAPDGDALPKEIKKTVKKVLLDDNNELAVWRIAGDGWRTVLRDRANLLSDDEDRSLNTPKPDLVKDFFLQNVGIRNITEAWKWHKTTVGRARDRLTELVTLRGAIAHRGAPPSGVLKKDATDGLDLIRRLAKLSAKRVSEHLEAHTGKPLPALPAEET